MCRKAFNLGGESCATAFSDSVVLMAPGEDAAGALNPIIPSPEIDPVSKSVVLGGMRFWLEWALLSDDIPAIYADLMTIASVLVWVAKVPVDPETLNLAYIPNPMLPAMQGDRGQRENLLWTKLYHIPLGFNDGETQSRWVSSTGTYGWRDANFVAVGVWDDHFAPYKVKTKRTLSEFDALVFGVTSVCGVVGATLNPTPMAVDMYGQMALKRGRKTTL